VVNAPVDSVWNHVNSLQNLSQWSPWTDGDPNIKISYEGKEGAIGSVYRWEGNKAVGSGNQTITKTESPQRLETHLNFIEPFSGQAEAFINLAPVENGTKASWGFDTHYSYPKNILFLFVNMDNIMGEKYNTGLNRLKQLCEKH